MAHKPALLHLLQPGPMLLLSFLATATAATAQEGHLLWLRIETEVRSARPCGGARSEGLMDRSGLVLWDFRTDKGERILHRSRATPEATAALAQALGANRVGFAVGDCSVGSFQPEDFVTYTITWFGRGYRRRVLHLKDVGEPACLPETQAIFEAIGAFLAEPGTEGPTLACSVPPPPHCPVPAEILREPCP